MTVAEVDLVVRGLTVHPPWTVPIMAADGAHPTPKRCENRVWRLVNLPTHLVIHAGKTLDWCAFEFLADLGFHPDPTRVIRGAFVGVVELAGIHPAGDGDCLCGPWGMRDQYHWELANPRPFPAPIPGRGAQRAFHLPDSVLAAASAVIR